MTEYTKIMWDPYAAIPTVRGTSVVKVLKTLNGTLDIRETCSLLGIQPKDIQTTLGYAQQCMLHALQPTQPQPETLPLYSLMNGAGYDASDPALNDEVGDEMTASAGYFNAKLLG